MSTATPPPAPTPSPTPALADAAKMYGEKMLTFIKSTLGSTWEKLGEHKQDLITSTTRMGRLMVARAAGQDVTEDLADVKAQIANWSWVGADEASLAFWASVKWWVNQTVGLLGVFVSAAAAGFAQGAMHG